MPTQRFHINEYMARLGQRMNADEAEARLRPDPDRPRSPKIKSASRVSEATVENAWRILLDATDATEGDRARIADPQALADASAYAANIENFIGTVKMPVGVLGPLRVNGLHAKGDFYVPLATTEAALVASYARGAEAITMAGGATSALLSEGVVRAPFFSFRSIYEAGMFCSWVAASFDMLKEAADSTTRFGKLIDIAAEMEADKVYLICRYTTGDASGQNMVTIATEALCAVILRDCPVQPEFWFLEGNMSSDKKASALAFMVGRGRRVTAAVTLDREIVERRLRTSVSRMVDFWRASVRGGVMSGTIGLQGHFANGLAAVYIATGQDAACVSESSVGVSWVEERDDGLFISVTLPNLMLGTVGGGTGLPSQAAGLRILGLHGTGKAEALAEVIAALCLAGEISIAAAFSAGHFGDAHKRLARDRR